MIFQKFVLLCRSYVLVQNLNVSFKVKSVIFLSPPLVSVYFVPFTLFFFSFGCVCVCMSISVSMRVSACACLYLWAHMSKCICMCA